MKTRVKQIAPSCFLVQVKKGFFCRWKTLADVSGSVKKYLVKEQAEKIAAKSEFNSSVYSLV